MKTPIWVHGLSGLVGLFMVAAGAPKLLGQEAAVEGFAQMGFPDWFMVFVGFWECVGGVLIAVPVISPLGAFTVATIMMGAVWTQVATGETAGLAPASIVLVLSLLLVWLRKDALIAKLGYRKDLGD